MYGFLRRRVDEDWIPKKIEDPAISQFPEGYMIRSYNWLDRWGILPEPGGLNDQPIAWVEAIETMVGMHREVIDEYRVWKTAHGGT